MEWNTEWTMFSNSLFEKSPLVPALFLIHKRKLQETHGSKQNTTLTQMGCWRHLRQDVQRWLVDSLHRVKQSSFIADLLGILRSKDQRSCKAMIEKKKVSWYPQFRQYFERNVEPKLENFCIWSIDGK